MRTPHGRRLHEHPTESLGALELALGCLACAALAAAEAQAASVQLHDRDRARPRGRLPRTMRGHDTIDPCGHGRARIAPAVPHALDPAACSRRRRQPSHGPARHIENDEGYARVGPGRAHKVAAPLSIDRKRRGEVVGPDDKCRRPACPSAGVEDPPGEEVPAGVQGQRSLGKSVRVDDRHWNTLGTSRWALENVRVACAHVTVGTARYHDHISGRVDLDVRSGVLGVG